MGEETQKEKWEPQGMGRDPRAEEGTDPERVSVPILEHLSKPTYLPQCRGRMLLVQPSWRLQGFSLETEKCSTQGIRED